MQKQVNLLLILLFTFFISFITSCSQTELSKEQIIQIANELAKSEGIVLENRNIIYDEGNKIWEEKFKSIGEERAKRYEFLENKNYQAVCYAIKEGWLGGDFWVFVDKITGEVLIFYGEE